MGIIHQSRALLDRLLQAKPELLVMSQGRTLRVSLPLNSQSFPSEDLASIPMGRVFDASGQSRTQYAPLLASHLIREMSPPPRSSVLRFAESVQPASAAMRSWAAWLCHQVSETRIAADLTARILDEQSTAGHFHPLTIDTSLDAFVFDEFAAIHAMHLLATATSNSRLREAVRRAALYHLATTQPDTTSQQPWGMPAFAAFDDTRPMAEQQIHDATIFCQTHPGGHPVTCLLLMDFLRGVASHENGG